MILTKAFETFVDGSPVCVMIRGAIEYALSAKFVDQVFDEVAKRQYTHELLFSQIVDVMGDVVCQVFPSVNAAYKKRQAEFSVSRRALYGKINLVEPRVIQELLRRTARRLAPVVAKLRRRAGRKPMLPGFRVRILDGNHLAASQHRIKELRDIAAGPLPGQSLVVFDPDAQLITDVFPCEDAHTQERILLVDVLDVMEPNDVWIADRNFCTATWLFQTAANGAYFVVRHHAVNVRWEAAGKYRKVGRTETGMVYEQRVDVIDDWGTRLSVRRITVKLDEPTEDGDNEIHILTNLPNRVKAIQIAEAYRGRWKLEGAFGELATALNCEISSLGYPPAALFAFVTGLMAYNILSVVRSALVTAHGEECVDQISAYYITDEIRGMMRGMTVAIPDNRWTESFDDLTPQQMTNVLLGLAKRVKIECFTKHRRGPKKPIPKRTKYKRQTHVSTARILAERGA
jgi:IS4 transposase